MILDQELNGSSGWKDPSLCCRSMEIERMAAAARVMGRPEAAARIVDECHALVRGVMCGR
jgi:hypothetical protein